MYRLINALGFQIGWFTCIAAVRHDLEIPALLICSVLVVIHFVCSHTRLIDFKLSIICLGLGIAVDSSLQFFSVIDFYGWALGPLSPFWLWMIWVMFGLTLNSSLSFLQSPHLFWSAIAGMVFGPVSYLAGTKLGAASFDNTLFPLATLAFIWMITLPLLVYISKISLSPTEVTHDAA